jgi:hypothetical protein
VALLDSAPPTIHRLYCLKKAQVEQLHTMENVEAAHLFCESCIFFFILPLHDILLEPIAWKRICLFVSREHYYIAVAAGSSQPLYCSVGSDMGVL